MRKALVFSSAILWCVTGPPPPANTTLLRRTLPPTTRNPGTADIPFKTIHAAITGAGSSPGHALCSRGRISGSRELTAPTPIKAGREPTSASSLGRTKSLRSRAAMKSRAGRSTTGARRRCGPHRGGRCTSGQLAA